MTAVICIPASPNDHVDPAPTSAALLASIGVRMAFARGEEVYAQDEDADLIYQVVSGAVRTTRLMSDGRRQIGDFYYAGDVVGLETSELHRFSAETLSDAVVLVAKRRPLALIAGKIVTDAFMAHAASRELDRAQDHLLLLGRKTALEKVASFLLDAADRSGGARATLAMGRLDMADYLGLTIETVSRMLTQLQGADIVAFTEARTFSVKNRAALVRLSQ